MSASALIRQADQWPQWPDAARASRGFPLRARVVRGVSLGTSVQIPA